MSEQQYDPTAEGQSVEKVTEHLKTADHAETERVLAAEAAGQDRSGVRKAAQARQAELAEQEKSEGDGTTPKLDTKAPTLSEQAASFPEATDEPTRQGYHGLPPSLQGDNPADLSLAAVTGQKGR